ncbi:VOC family protein [uncultured Paraglaciecola sp.]|uniref:VOC family protein n=1 Tax=uncultured Paraglaciecola sp. TaxID=1765024 RepID=UPI0030DB2484|tara:strand:+ start:15706 stop:16173 length:468 start_codon:yes stop_codon:yes gene_type:complete
MPKLIAALLFISVLSFNANAKSTILTEGLNHLGLTVSNLDSSVSFFIDTLGWEEKGGDPDYPAKFVSDGKVFLTLWQTSSQVNTVKFDRKKNVGLHHLALTVVSFEALDELYERFKKIEGVVIEFAPELAFGGPGKHMMIREPSGNRLEFIFSPK